MLDHLCTPHPWMYLAFLAAPMVARRRSGLIARRAQRRGIWFGVAPTRAYVTSVERVLDLHTGARRFKEDGELMERLALPFFRRSGCPSSFLRAHRAVALFSTPMRTSICAAPLSAAAANLVGNFLTTPLSCNPSTVTIPCADRV